YQGPTIPITSSSSPKVVERETEVTKETMPPTNNRNTKDVQPVVVQIKTLILNSEPVAAPKLRDKANDQKEKYFQIFQDLNFNISFADALILMPKFGPTIKTLLTNKDKLYELARTLLNEHCSAVLLKKFPEKLGDLGKFLIPFIDFDADPRAPLILGRSFLTTKKALINVFEEELTFRVGKEAIPFNLDQTSRYSTNYNDMTANRIDVIDMACEEYSQEGGIFLLEAFLNDDPSLPPPTQGNYFPQLRKELKICEAKNDKSSIDEPSEVELKDLPPYLEYTFLEGNDKLSVIIAKNLSVEEKAALIKVLKSHKQAIAWKLSDIKGNNLKFCTHKIIMEDDIEPAVQH
nr:reverse transcriptase domain-containing protein [Tanacetum cinerariifolium]